MPRILDSGKLRVYLYANDDNRHHLPHCHVYWNGDDHASVVSLPDLGVIAGETLPRAARRNLRANVDILVAAWRALNPCMEQVMNQNWDRAAMRFRSARHADRQQMLEVTFENGDHFLVAVEAVLPASNATPFRRNGSQGTDRVAPPDWSRMRIGETGDVLEVPAGDSVIEIPWDRIRALVDPDFRAHLADKAVERARRIGSRIRAMRLEAGLTRAAVAAKVGVSRQVVASMEAGQLNPRNDLIEQIAIALGRRLADLAEV